MKKRKTVNEIVQNKKIAKPSHFANLILRTVENVLYERPCSVKYIRHVEPNKYKNEPVILVCNHSTRIDHAFIHGVMRKRRYNFLAAEQEFHRTKFKLAFKLGGTLPKVAFVSDTRSIRHVITLLRKRKNACLALCPSGTSSISGAQQPCQPGVGKMLKRFGVHVLCVRIHGAYFVCPKFDLKERHGHVEVELDELFSPQQLNELSADEISLKVDEALYTDDYEWNEKRQYSYKCRGGAYAEQMEQILYKCPKCGVESQMESKGDKICCKACGNGATLDDKYNLVPIGDSVMPYNPREWFDWQRREMRRAVEKIDFEMQEHVTLGILPKYEYLKDNQQALLVGDGIIRINKDGFFYDGTREGENWSVFISSNAFRTTISSSDGSFFATNASGEYLHFIPDSGGAIRWHLAIEELHRANGGKWQNYPWFDYDKEGFATKKTTE